MHISNGQFEDTFETHTVEKSQTNAISVTLHPLKQAIYKFRNEQSTMDKVKNATFVTMHILNRQFEDSFENTQCRKVKRNATSVAKHLLKQAT